MPQSPRGFSPRSTTATYGVATAKTVALSVIKDRRHGRRNLRRPQRDPSAGSSRHALPTIQECCRPSSRPIAWVPLSESRSSAGGRGISTVRGTATDLPRYCAQLQEKDCILSARLRGKVATFAMVQGRAASVELSRAFLAIAEIHGTARRAVPARGSRRRNLYSSETRQTP
jgi:hypothetical protein